MKKSSSLLRASYLNRYFGLLGIGVFFIVFSAFFVLSRGAMPSASELAYSERSVLGSKAGSVVPASCDSASPFTSPTSQGGTAGSHFPGDCTTTCPSGSGSYDPYYDPTASTCATSCIVSPANPKVGDPVTFSIAPADVTAYFNAGNYVSHSFFGPSSTYTGNPDYGSWAQYQTSVTRVFLTPGTQYAQLNFYTQYWADPPGSKWETCSVNVALAASPYPSCPAPYFDEDYGVWRTDVYTCSNGTPSNTADDGYTNTWQCAVGSNTTSCSYNYRSYPSPVYGVCGTANYNTVSSIPAGTAACAKGTRNSLTPQYNCTHTYYDDDDGSSTYGQDVCDAWGTTVVGYYWWCGPPADGVTGDNFCWATFVSANPTATLTADPTSVVYGQPSTLTWSSTDAAACTTSWGGSGTSGIDPVLCMRLRIISD